LTIICDEYIIDDKTEGGRKSAHYELKWEIPDSSLDKKPHTIFVGELLYAGVLREGEPMTYAYYHQVNPGTTPKTAPHYVEEKKEGGIMKLAKYKCSVCGYIYDTSKGDPESNTPPGTPFKKLRDDWTCPVCGRPKFLWPENLLHKDYYTHRD
jgi:rubredoxin